MREKVQFTYLNFKQCLEELRVCFIKQMVARKATPLTISKEIGVSRNTIDSFIKNKRIPQFKVAAKLAEWVDNMECEAIEKNNKKKK